MRKILLVMLFVLMSGCETIRTVYVPVREPITIPTPPKVVVMDNGRYDKSKYPETDWVKEPTVDLKNRRAYWGFDDVEKLSNALTNWPRWAVSVESIINEHNRNAGDKNKIKETQRSWWSFWK
jgi:uncharacterized protein YceK